jgi:hypothetical protein
MFKIIVVIAVQSIFRLEMYQDDVFLFFKIIFNISTLKWFKNTKKILILNKKNLKILKTRVEQRFQTAQSSLAYIELPDKSGQ